MIRRILFVTLTAVILVSGCGGSGNQPGNPKCVNGAGNPVPCPTEWT